MTDLKADIADLKAQRDELVMLLRKLLQHRKVFIPFAVRDAIKDALAKLD